MDVKPIVARREPDGQTYQGTTTGTTSLPGDEEGRHRTHPLYNEGPKADGLYHCPYEDKPDCQHKPTKLKCNYEYETTCSPVSKHSCNTLTNSTIAASSLTPISSLSAVRWRLAPSKSFPLRHVCSVTKERLTGCMATGTDPTFVFIVGVNEVSPATDFRGGTICSIT